MAGLKSRRWAEGAVDEVLARLLRYSRASSGWKGGDDYYDYFVLALRGVLGDDAIRRIANRLPMPPARLPARLGVIRVIQDDADTSRPDRRRDQHEKRLARIRDQIRAAVVAYAEKLHSVTESQNAPERNQCLAALGIILGLGADPTCQQMLDIARATARSRLKPAFVVLMKKALAACEAPYPSRPLRGILDEVQDHLRHVEEPPRQMESPMHLTLMGRGRRCDYKRIRLEANGHVAEDDSVGPEQYARLRRAAGERRVDLGKGSVASHLRDRLRCLGDRVGLILLDGFSLRKDLILELRES